MRNVYLYIEAGTRYQSAYNNSTTSDISVIKEIREMDVQNLILYFKDELSNLSFNKIYSLTLNPSNRQFIRYLLARITSHVEKQCGINTDFNTYFSHEIDKPFEIEHLWANKYQRHKDEIPNREEFILQRNNIGGLILLPRGFNQSFNDDPYNEKVKHYYGPHIPQKG